MIETFRGIWRFAGKEQRNIRRSVIACFFNAVFHMFEIAAIYYTILALLDGKTGHATAWQALGLLAVSILGSAVIRYFSQLEQTHAGYFMAANKRVAIGQRMKSVPMGYFNDNSLGNITAVVTTTLGDVENNAARCLVSVIGGFLNTLAMCLAILLVDWRLGLLAIAGILAYLLVTELSQRSLLKTGPARQHAQMKLVEAVLEYIQGMGVVKAYGLDKDSGQTVQKTVDESCEKALGLEHSVAPWMGLRQITVRLFAVALAVCALALYSGGSLPLTRCLLMLVASFMLYAELESAGNMADNLQMLGASMDKANSIDDTPVMDIDGAELQPEDASVRFEDVSFSYGERTILDYVSLTVPAGSTTAVVGPSGGGKSTLCQLIPRFYDVTDGAVRIDGHDVRQVTQESLRQNVGVVQQDVFLFAASILENIRYGKPGASEEEVARAAKLAEIYDDIVALPEGFNTYVGERGTLLSGGQKQRISIARVFLKDPPVLILDEATSALDNESEKIVQQSLDRLAAGRTCLTIAHRLTTVRHADRIYVVTEKGIAESGTHDELMARGGAYAALYKAYSE